MVKCACACILNLVGVWGKVVAAVAVYVKLQKVKLVKNDLFIQVLSGAWLL